MSTFYDTVSALLASDPRPTWAELGARFGMSAQAVRGKYRRGRNRTRVENPGDERDAAGVLFADRKQVGEVGWRELIGLASAGQEIGERLSDSQRVAEARIDTDRPIAVMCSGDWHLGDMATDHIGWQADMEFLLGEPNLYMIEVGDDRQNVRTFKTLAAVLGQVLSPALQGQLMKSLVDELTVKNKLLAK